MNNSEKEIKCAVCQAYLFEEDDVVHCPVCGAPHHRECYNKNGHCALEEFHGTENEYGRHSEEQTADNSAEAKISSDETVTCSICGEKYDKNLKKCPKCSARDFSQVNPAYAQFDFLGGVPADFRLEEDVTAEEAKKFVAANTHRYIPKFVTLNKSNKISWNWMAFLFPASWLFSRKMYKNGIIVGILSIISTLFSYPLSNSLYDMGIPASTSYAEMFGWIMEKIPEIDTAVIAFAMIGSVLSLIIHIIFGLLGDSIYRKHVISSVRTIKAESEDIDYDYRKKGGVNTLLFLLSLMLLQYIPNIIAILL